MTIGTAQTAAVLKTAQVEDSRIAAELESAERAGAEALQVARLRIEKDWSAKRLAEADEDHRIALAAERAAAADLLMDSVAATLEAEDESVWQSVHALMHAVDEVLDADHHRNATVSSLSAELISKVGTVPTDRFRNQTFGGMTVDGRRLARTSDQLGITCIGIVADLVSLGSVQLGHALHAAASTGGGLREPVRALAGGTR